MTMTWLAEEFPDRAADADNEVFRLHVEALCWSARRLLDCRVPKRDLRRFAFVADAEAAADRAVELGWWIDRDDHWELLFGAEWQETSQQVEGRRLKNRRAQAHKRGNHRWCLPGRCPAVTSSDDTTDDSVDDSSDESSSSLGWAGLDRPLREVPTDLDETACEVCGVVGEVDARGLCGMCAEQVAS